jgi:hypothetical protein
MFEFSCLFLTQGTNKSFSMKMNSGGFKNCKRGGKNKVFKKEASANKANAS